MAYDAKILADSTNEECTTRLTSMELTYPRCIHSEFMTHRAFSRNAASSRAIPINKMLERIESDPFMPLVWGRNQAGMQASRELDPEEITTAKRTWMFACKDALWHARQLQESGLHKQIVNRVVEPFMWITVIASGNEIAWENFFSLRCHEAAEPHIQKIAYMARRIYDVNQPRVLKMGFDHLPLTGFPGDEEFADDHESLRKISVGRCARVSYLTHDGRRAPEEDIRLHDDLMKNGHWSPFEHVATMYGDLVNAKGGNFGNNWIQYRKRFPNEVCRKAKR